MKIMTKLLLTGIMAVFCVSIAKAQYSNAVVGATLIYSNGFDGSASVNITNTSADQEFNIFGGPAVTTNWVDLAGPFNTNAFYANGTVGTEQADIIALPFTPVSNHVYALQASVTLSGNPGTWIAAGFSADDKIQGTSTSGNHDAFNGNDGWNWALINYSGNVEYFLGQSGGTTIYNATAFTAAPNLTHVLTLILDTTFDENPSNAWIAAGYIDGVPMGSHIFPTKPTIIGLGYGQYTVISAPQNIKWNSFTLLANQELILQQPVSANINQGSTFTTSVQVAGTPPFFYQWYTNGVPILNATNANLVINSVSTNNASTNYYCVVTNVAYGAVTSSPAILGVYSTPQFLTADPITHNSVMTLFGGANSYLGASPSFSVYAGGQGPMGYFWLTNGVAVGGATSNIFTFANCQLNGPTNFTCIASNSLGTATNTWLAQYIPAPTAPYPQQVIADGAVGYWRLDDTNVDGADDGNGDDGYICNDFISGNNGIYTNIELAQVGYYAMSNGIPVTNDPTETSVQFAPYVSTLSADANSIGTNIDFSGSSNAEFSVSVWANGSGQNSASEPVNGGIIVKGYYGSEEFALDDGGSGGTLRFAVRNAAGTLSSAASTVQIGGVNGWHHLVGVCDETNGLIYLYINGLLAATASVTPGSGLLAESLAPITIAANPTAGTGAGDHVYYGELDDAAVFNYPMTASQVNNLYAAAGGVNPLSLVAPLPPTNLVFMTNTTVTIPATALGLPPLGFYWTNLTTSTVMASGVTNTSSTLKATLTIPNAPGSLGGDQLELVVTNALGFTNWFTTLAVSPTPITVGYTNSILYSNFFGGGTWNLAGQSASVANSLVGGTNTLWTDALGTNDNGVMQASGLDASLEPDSWVLPFKPEPGFVYTLNAQLTFFGNPGNWVGLGFAQNIPLNSTNGYGRFSDGGTTPPEEGPEGYDWIILTESSGNVQDFGGPGGQNQLISDNGFFLANTPGTHTVQVVLDTTAAQWVMSAFVDGTQAGTNYPYPANPPIGAIGITQNTLTTLDQLQWNNISLSAVSPNGFPPYLLTAAPPASILMTNTTVSIPATGYGTGPWGYYWSNNSTIIASGTTNNTAPDVANLSVPTSSLSAGTLDLVLTNAIGTNISSITLVAPVTTFTWGVTNGNLYLSWPAAFKGVAQLQSQTNSVGVGLSNNWVDVAGSLSTNQVVFPINHANGTVFFRLHP